MWSCRVCSIFQSTFPLAKTHHPEPLQLNFLILCCKHFQSRKTQPLPESFVNLKRTILLSDRVLSNEILRQRPGWSVPFTGSNASNSLVCATFRDSDVRCVFTIDCISCQNHLHDYINSISVAGRTIIVTC